MLAKRLLAPLISVFLLAVLAAAPLALTTGCSGCQTIDVGDVDHTSKSDVGIRLVSSNGPRVIVEFIPNAGFTHVVQEIELDTGHILVECFRCDGRPIYDYHSWHSRPHSRRMKVYAADVTGADERHGFAHLPENMDGLKTTVGTGFNADYQSTHETRGKIVKRSPKAFLWTIKDDGVTVDVGLPDTN